VSTTKWKNQFLKTSLVNEAVKAGVKKIPALKQHHFFKHPKKIQRGSKLPFVSVERSQFEFLLNTLNMAGSFFF